MVVEERMYVLHTGADLQKYLTIYESEGLPVQKPILGGFLGYFTTEFGTQNQLVHLWAYPDLLDRNSAGRHHERAAPRRPIRFEGI